MDPWLDEVDIRAGEEWERAIRRGLGECDVVIACLSNKSVGKTGYVQKEIRIALDIADLKPEGAIFIIPLRLEACVMPDRLQKWQRVDYFEPDGYAKLICSLNRLVEARCA
jgi:hypothetical protein